MNNIIEFLMVIVVGNLNKLPKGVGKENPIVTLGPMTHGTLMFYKFLS